MTDMVLEAEVLPESIFRGIHAAKVKVHEEDGVFTLTPLKLERSNIDKFIGMFSDGKLSSEKFMRNKEHEK